MSGPNCSCGCGGHGGCVGAPMQLNSGLRINPNVLRGQDDMETGYPVTYRRHLWFPGAQLNCGTEHLAMHKLGTPAAAYAYGAVARIPGQTRTSGQNLADFVPHGNSPSQWDYHVAMGPGMQPTSPGGPGQIGFTGFRNPGSGA